MGAIYKNGILYSGGGGSGESIIYLTKAEYDVLDPPVEGQMYGITDWDGDAVELIDDTTTAVNKTWSSSKINTTISNLDLDDLHDTSFSSVKNGDGLVYDATTQKWENVPIVTQEMQDILGAKNLLPNEATTQTINGITFTVNADKSVTLNGTSTQAIYLILYTINSSEKNICKAGKRYKISGYNPADASLDWGYVYIVGTSAYSSSVALVSEFDGWEYDSTKYVYLFVRKGKTLNNIIVKPMITIASQPNSDYAHYVPYAKTNRELTEDVNIEEITITPASGVTIDYKSYMKQGKMVTLNCRFVISSTYSFSTNGLIASINCHLKQTNGFLVPTFKTWAGTTGGVLQINPNGSIVTPDVSTFTAGSYVINVCFIVD